MTALVAMAIMCPFANLTRRQALLLALIINLASSNSVSPAGIKVPT
ncbi:hypothetical protein AB9E34_34235 [Rhizobium leguminosarum]